MREFVVSVEDEIGSLRDAAKVLSKAGVNILAISSEVRGPKAMLRIVADREAPARAALLKAKYDFGECDLLQLVLDDEPGALARNASLLADAGVNVRAVYIIGKAKGKTDVAFSVDDFGKAMKACHAGEKAPWKS